MPVIISNNYLNLKDPSTIRIGVIETNLKLGGNDCTVFQLMLEDDINHFSLIRFIEDFKELDNLLFQHFPKHRIPLPKLSTQKKSIFSSLKKSNSQLLEIYLERSISNKIGQCSLFRDFLSVQRDEDRIISKSNLCQLVVQHQVEQEYLVKRKRTSTSGTNRQQQQKKLLVLPPSPPCTMTEFPRHDSGLSILPDSTSTKQVEEKTIDQYELIKVLGKGATGKVILVRDQNSHRLYALKTITKSWSITKREVEHIRMERDILTTLSSLHHPFLIRLFHAFQDTQNLYLVLDYHAGADLATLLQRFIYFPPEQCRLYAAEMVMGLQELHRNSILYRDLKPENVLLAADGHIILTDFGLSKLFDPRQDPFDHRTTTFCGTPEYLAPEIILQEEEYSYAADFWSLGTMIYEMLTGVTPFAADTQDEMYDRVLFDDLSFPNGFDLEAKDLITGLLERDPLDRLGAGYGGVFELRSHAYFSNHLNWKDVYAKRIQPLFVPMRSNEIDLRHFDPDFLNMSTHLKEETDEAILLRQRWLPETCPAGLIQDAFRGYSYIYQEPENPIQFESEISFFGSEFNFNGGLDQEDNDSLLIKDFYLHSNDSHSSSVIIKHDVSLKSSRHQLMNPSHFHSNQSIRNSTILSSVKDDDLSTWIS